MCIFDQTKSLPCLVLLLALGAALPAAAAPAHHRASQHAPRAATPATPLDAVPKLSNFADLVFDGTVGENAPVLDLDFAPGATLGALPLAFEKTRLADIVALDGGTIHTQADSSATWLCYTRHAATPKETPTTVWFTAGSTGGAAADALGMVVVENVDASRASGCTTAPSGLAFPAFGVPAIGASLRQLSGKFGSARRDRQGNVYYDSARPLNDGSGNTVYQTLGYRVTRAGKVVAISLGQTTTH